MRLKGSCHCGAVRFTCRSRAPVPFMHCHCSICRKVAGSGGYAIHIHADADTLEVEGENAITIYQAFLDHPERTERGRSQRRFCRHCATMLWVWDPEWPELIHPFASAIDTPLPVPPERVHIRLVDKPDWVFVPEGPHEQYFERYPDESLIEWHRRHGLVDEVSSEKEPPDA